MSLSEEYTNCGEHRPSEKSKQILFGVFGDLLGRRGFKQVWDDIGDEIRGEILESCLGKIEDCLEGDLLSR